MTKPVKRRVPMVFRFAGALLLVAVIGGQIWQHRPASEATHLILASVERHCPTAARAFADPSIADGAHALDRWGFRVIADAVAPQTTSRCAQPQSFVSARSLLDRQETVERLETLDEHTGARQHQITPRRAVPGDFSVRRGHQPVVGMGSGNCYVQGQIKLGSILVGDGQLEKTTYGPRVKYWISRSMRRSLTLDTHPNTDFIWTQAMLRMGYIRKNIA